MVKGESDPTSLQILHKFDPLDPRSLARSLALKFYSLQMTYIATLSNSTLAVAGA